MEQIAQILPYIQIALSVLIVVLVLLQQSEADLGGAFGGRDSMNAPARTRRGLERTLFTWTIIISVLFVASAILGLIVH